MTGELGGEGLTTSVAGRQLLAALQNQLSGFLLQHNSSASVYWWLVESFSQDLSDMFECLIHSIL